MNELSASAPSLSIANPQWRDVTLFVSLEEESFFPRPPPALDSAEYAASLSFAVCADEIGMSRLYGGIHFSFDNLKGKASGQQIGEYISTHCLLA